MLISFVFHPKHRSKSSAVRGVLIWLPVLERVYIALVSLFRRRVFDRRAIFLCHIIKITEWLYTQQGCVYKRNILVIRTAATSGHQPMVLHYFNDVIFVVIT